MEKKIEDYLHLYLGCECQLGSEIEIPDTAPQVEVLTGITVKKNGQTICYFLNKTISYRTIESVTPILRPLSDMTEEELKEVRRTMLEYSDLSFNPSAHQHMSKRGQTFYYENYDDEGNHISSSISNISNLPLKCIPLLLSKGFDLFDLIEAGLVIDKTKL